MKKLDTIQEWLDLPLEQMVQFSIDEISELVDKFVNSNSTLSEEYTAKAVNFIMSLVVTGTMEVPTNSDKKKFIHTIASIVLNCLYTNPGENYWIAYGAVKILESNILSFDYLLENQKK